MRAFLCLFILASAFSTLAAAVPVNSRLSLFTANGTTSFCSHFEQACASACGTATPTTTCKVNNAVLKRGALGSLSCKCDSKDSTSQVISSMFKPMTTSSNSTATNSAFKKVTGAGNKPQAIAASVASSSSSAASFPTAPVVANNIVALNHADIIGTWTSYTTSSSSSSAPALATHAPSFVAASSNGEAIKPVVL